VHISNKHAHTQRTRYTHTHVRICTDMPARRGAVPDNEHTETVYKLKLKPSDPNFSVGPEVSVY